MDDRRFDRNQLIRQVTRTRQPTFTANEVVTPLLVGGRLIGTLDAINEATPRVFTDHDVQVLQALADYAAIAIENARLFHELDQSKEREKTAIRNVFERYVTPAVVEQLLNSPRMATLGGAKKTIAVLFADVRGFTALSEQIKPETLVQALNDHLAIGAQAILKQEGTLDKFMGDGIMAFFNAPLLQPDYALRAVKAALDMQHYITAYAAKMPEAIPMRFGVGITSGEAIVGNIGTAQLMNFTAVGACVNLAKRMQELARGGQVLIDQATYDNVALRVLARPLGPIDVKGLRLPIEVFEVLSLR